MHFVWFWTFWHWSKESFRDGTALRGPLHGIASHWDEWLAHEASEQDLRAIAEVGKTEAGQRAFIDWINQVWAREIESRENQSVARFALVQLAPLPPFAGWEALASYRAGYGAGGVSAIVLAGRSTGESADIRRVEAVLLPRDPDTTAAGVAAESFRADKADLEAPRQAALSMLGGTGLLALLSLWAVAGRRPYPRALGAALVLGWLAAAALIGRLLFGAEPGDALVPLSATLVALVGLLGGVGFFGVSWQCWRAWRRGRDLRRGLREGQVRLRMPGGLTIKGRSAGLAFCLNTMLAAQRAAPPPVRDAWIWKRFFEQFDADRDSWSATGVVTPHGRVRAVVLAPKLRACLRHAEIANVLVPLQRNSGRKTLESLSSRPKSRAAKPVADDPGLVRVHVGFAAEPSRLRVWRCLHVAQAVLAIGRLGSWWQVAVSALALAVVGTTLSGLADLHAILLPPPAPLVVGPGSPSPYYLWVSIDSPSSRHFRAVLESTFWANRRVDFQTHGGVFGSVRAEISLQRLSQVAYNGEEDGVVWIERRRRFLGREYTPGERVGLYSLSYISTLKHE